MGVLGTAFWDEWAGQRLRVLSRSKVLAGACRWLTGLFDGRAYPRDPRGVCHSLRLMLSTAAGQAAALPQ